jgi:hypothetical protein
MDTPTTPAGLRRYDQLDPAAAVLAAWTQPGANPGWHADAQHAVRRSMPLLARALDRLAQEQQR